jgi:hypothetical protein
MKEGERSVEEVEFAAMAGEGGGEVIGVQRGKRNGVDVESVGGVREPLLAGERVDEAYTWRSVALPFLFPAVAGSLYGYDIGERDGLV